MLISLYGHTHQNHAITPLQNFITALLANGFQVEIEKRFASYLRRNEAMPRQCLAVNAPSPKSSLLISIGGDGTLLRAARWLKQLPLPIAGINTGHLGYLSAFTFEHAGEIYETLLNGRFRVENRSLLNVEVTGGGTAPTHLTALNEIAITRGDNAAMLNIATVIDNGPSLNYVGDGLILSTPTGSTAYNLSVGGPILDPELAGWVLSPIAAHSLSMRPLVVKDSSVIDITVTTRGTGYRLSADGKSVTLPLQARLRITKAPYKVKLILQPSHMFTDTLRDKLGMGAPRK